ncbi:MAG: YdbL family protein [Amphiplicatus sp.]
MKPIIKVLAAAIALLGSALAGAAYAASALIEDAKSKCVVGEQADGYLGVIDSGEASAELRREVDSVNLQRKAAYARLAERNGVTVADAAKVTAEKLINQAPSGQCVRDQSGSWLRKP